MTLSTLILIPLVGGLVASLAPAESTRQRLVAGVALAFAFGALGLSIYLAFAFDSGQPGLQWVADRTWISGLGIHYKVGIDGINIFLILMTTTLWAAAITYSAFKQWDRPKLFYFMMLLGETAVLGAFMAQDLILFVAFFDLMLIPFYFLIGIWGGEGRVKATTKFVIYTLVGSLLMLVAAVATGVLNESQNGQLTFVISELQNTPLAEGSQRWIFLFFAAAFLVKMPAFPLHGWMPDAYRAAPIPVLAVLSAVLTKVAAYGFLRIVLPLFPDASQQFQELLLVIATISILYGSIMAFSQSNVRLIVGFSSMAQLGFITLGIFALRPEGGSGAVLQMVNHGLVVLPLFVIIAILADRYGTEDLNKMSGAAFRAPVLAALFLIVALATLAIPGSANFVGEFLILLAVFQSNIAIAVIASIGVILAAVYMIRFYQRSMHNPLSSSEPSREMSVSDGLVLVPLVALIIALGVHPQTILKPSEASIQRSIHSAGKTAGESDDHSAYGTQNKAATQTVRKDGE